MTNNIPAVNTIELDRKSLVDVLEYLGYRIGEHFSHTIRLIVHGGACMLLHPGLYNLAEQQAKMTPEMPIRKTTRDVDYIHRAFVNESLGYGEVDAPKKLEKCISETASKFGLGLDWMNSAADVALPMAVDPTGRPWDPIYAASVLSKSNIQSHTVFSSANGMLKLIGVPPFWAIALKLVRFTKWDPYDICFLLKYVTIRSGGRWTTENLEELLQRQCWTMGYAKYPPQRKLELRSRIDHSIMMVNAWYAKTPTLEEFFPTAFRTDANAGNHLVKDHDMYDRRDLAMGTMGLDRNRVEWGGGDRSGWKASFAGDWIKPNASPSQIPPPPLNQQVRHAHSMALSTISPLLDSRGHSLISLDSLGQQKVTENVADWVAEKERKRQSEERDRERGNEKRDTVTPFVPTLPPARDHHGRPEDRNAPRLHTQSQPPIQIYQPTYHTPPPQAVPAQHHTMYKSVDTHTQSTSPVHAVYPNTHPPTNIYRSSPQHPWHAHPPPAYYITPMKVEITLKRKEKRKARDKSRDKARSTKKQQQDYVLGADGSYVSRVSEMPLDYKTRQDKPRGETNATPTIYPLTTVVYYNQQQNIHPSSSIQPSPHQPSLTQPPPVNHPNLNHRQSRTSIVSPVWSSPTSMNVPGTAPQMQVQTTPMYSAPPPTTSSRIYSQPIIPPPEYMRQESSNGPLHKLVNALKI